MKRRRQAKKAPRQVRPGKPAMTTCRFHLEGHEVLVRELAAVPRSGESVHLHLGPETFARNVLRCSVLEVRHAVGPNATHCELFLRKEG